MFKLLNKKKNNKGFTLVELVIAIAILAILVGLLAPQYTKYVEKSRKSADASNMDEMVKAVQTYAADGEKDVTATADAGATIVLDKSGVEADAAFTDALDEYCPNYTNMKMKSTKWGDADTELTATIKVTSEGAVTVTYSPKSFADYIGAETTE